MVQRGSFLLLQFFDFVLGGHIALDVGGVPCVEPFVAGFCGLTVVGCVLQDTADVGVMVGGHGLVAGLEVEHLTCAALPDTAGAEHVARLVPRHEHQLIGIGNLEGLCVDLLTVDVEVRGNACGDGVGRVDVPHDLVEVVSPQQVAGGAYHTAEHLGIVAGVEDD